MADFLEKCFFELLFIMKSVFKMEKFAVFGKTKLEKCGFGATYGLLSLLLKRMFCEKIAF